MKRLALLLLTLPAAAFGWGETGHRAVCQIAFDELTPVARAEVERLLNLDASFREFADACLFADTPERIRMFDHFMNLPRSQQAVTTGDCPTADTCVLPAIQADFDVLRSSSASDQDKLLAVKLLGHWVGDIHQPLHVSFRDDLGGNSIEISDASPETSLHGVWDYEIIASMPFDDYRTLAGSLRSAISAEQRSKWSLDSPVEWANESFQITTSPTVGYCTRKQGACWYSSSNMMLGDGEPPREMAISEAYLAAHAPAVERRLQQAGIRLAALLNEAFR